MALNTWVLLTGFGWCLPQGWYCPEGSKGAAVVVGTAPLGTCCPSRGHGADCGLDGDRAARGGQTTDTSLLNGGDSVAGLFPFLPLFQSISCGELPDSLFGKEPFKFKSFFCLSCSKCYNPSGHLTSGFRIILSLRCHTHLAILFPNMQIAQRALSLQWEVPAGSVRTNSHLCRTQAEAQPQYLGKSRKP